MPMCMRYRCMRSLMTSFTDTVTNIIIIYCGNTESFPRNRYTQHIYTFHHRNIDWWSIKHCMRRFIPNDGIHSEYACKWNEVRLISLGGIVHVVYWRTKVCWRRIFDIEMLWMESINMFRWSTSIRVNELRCEYVLHSIVMKGHWMPATGEQ